MAAATRPRTVARRTSPSTRSALPLHPAIHTKTEPDFLPQSRNSLILSSPRRYFTAILGRGLRVSFRGGRRGKPRLYEIFYNLRMKRVVHAACPHDCPDACGVLITIEDGRATRIQGDPEHPVTRGFLCAKVAKYLDRVYSPERVLYPMRRVRPKGHIAAASAGEGARVTEARSFAPDLVKDPVPHNLPL